MKTARWRKRTLVFACVLNSIAIFNTQFASAQNSRVTSYRVAGWQAELVQQSPNLANFYWEPITKRRILTTKRTGKQAETAPLPQRTIVSTKVAINVPKQKFTKRTEIAYSTKHAETACALSYSQSPVSEVSSSTLNVQAKLASKIAEKTKPLAKGLVAHQACLSLTSVH
ncbi:MAG: hypothetical protein JST89_24355 [Cyanobacteria bacterium SZAS-4]|nr:hypothetical protein [Cyanobacteria bacterium SZAS-4]